MIGKARRAMSGLLAVMTVVITCISPISAYAAETDSGTPPSYETVKDMLDQDEVVVAHDLEVDMGSDFDLEEDLSGIDIPDGDKVKVKFHQAENSEGESFTTDHEDTYEAIYYVEPTNTEHPEYQISRKIVVKEVDIKAESTASAESETKDAEQISDEEFDAEIEASEDQPMVDPESGVTLSEVMEEAVKQDVDLEDLEVGEIVSFEMPVMLASASTGTQGVSITRGSWYHYADYGLGSYITAPYYVSWGGVSATAYCVQPSKNGPDDGTYSIEKLSDSKALAKVCYYGTKASEEDGFFDEKHPDFSAGKRFIITHLAAAYANGSSDWASGANATGQALAMELYNYCMSMPEIPDVAMSFSDADVKAYVDGNLQRTKTITFNADALQSITFNLPTGVKLVNVSTGETSAAGVKVEITGGTQFYLTAPLTQAVDYEETFSSSMKGSIDTEYSAYKIVTGGDTQDLALVFGEGVGKEAYVDFKVTWTKECYVSITKKDKETSNALAGAVYGIYSDKACTKLIKQMPATDASGFSKATIEKTQDTVYLKEISVPIGYVMDTNSYNITLNIGKTSTKNVVDKRATATISLSKQDKETGSTPQGDASLTDAVYGLYAREDIVHPDGTTGVLYKAGELVTTLKTDKNGNASVSNLYLGKYYVKEMTPPVGYVLDETEHDIDCSYEGAAVPTVERSVISQETVIKQPFQVIKAADNGKTNADLLSGVGFSAWLVSDLKVNADGSYDFSSADPVVITADGETEMFTDEKGYAESIALPYGKYIVRETTSKHNFAPVDDFEVTITENHPNTPQTWRVLLDDEFSAKFQIIKKDAETKKPILLANTEFKVYDLDNEKYVEQVTTYPKTVVHTSYFTDEEGYLILPNSLKPGNYRIEEVNAPDGYTLNTDYVTVSVDTNTAYRMESTTGDAIIEVDYENNPVKGELSIIKQGQVLVSYDGEFHYEAKGLEGVKLEVYAAENIYTADHQLDENGNRLLHYAQDALVATVVTDEVGKAVVKNLPLGKYYVKEVNAPEGFVLNTAAVEAELTYVDQNTPIVYDDVTLTNDRQKVKITVEKQDQETGKALEGAVFGIYNAKDIRDASGKVMVKADTLLQKMTSDKDGQAVCTLDLPLGQYYVKELEAPEGYALSDEILTFDASYQGQDVACVELKSIMKNVPTKEDQPVPTEDEPKPTETSGSNTTSAPKTGDNSNMAVWALIAILSGISVFSAGMYLRIRRKHMDSEQ